LLQTTYDASIENDLVSEVLTPENILASEDVKRMNYSAKEISPVMTGLGY